MSLADILESAPPLRPYPAAPSWFERRRVPPDSCVRSRGHRTPGSSAAPDERAGGTGGGTAVTAHVSPLLGPRPAARPRIVRPTDEEPRPRGGSRLDPHSPERLPTRAPRPPELTAPALSAGRPQGRRRHHCCRRGSARGGMGFDYVGTTEHGRQLTGQQRAGGRTEPPVCPRVSPTCGGGAGFL